MIPLLIIFGVAVGVILVLRLLLMAHNYKEDRTTHFCANCGEQLLLHPSQHWSECTGWKCGNCGAWGNDATSTISDSRFSRQATHQAVINDVKELRRMWKKVCAEAAKKLLQQKGLEFIEANFHSEHGEIDLIFRDGDCLVFVEVLSRPPQDWERSAADTWCERWNTVRAYVRLKSHAQRIRLDTVEVLLGLDWKAQKVRHRTKTLNQIEFENS